MINASELTDNPLKDRRRRRCNAARGPRQRPRINESGSRSRRGALPRPALRGERVGVRGCVRVLFGNCIRGGSPSPGSHLRCDPTSPRIRLRPKAGFGGQERGEVRTDPAFHVAFTEEVIRGRCLSSHPHHASLRYAWGRRRSNFDLIALTAGPSRCPSPALCSPGRDQARDRLDASFTGNAKVV